LVYFITRKLALSIAAGGAEALSKILLYVFHERLWDRISLGKRTKVPCVIWFTGLSGSGKSTLATQLVENLKSRGLKVEHLDGDSIRKVLPQTGFSREQREDHIRRVGYLASILEKNGIIVVASLISPYEDSRQFVRGLCSKFVEIYLSTPMEVCSQRDPKGLYRKAINGEIKNFTGVSDPYEVPIAPELTFDTSMQSESDCQAKIQAAIRKISEGTHTSLKSATGAWWTSGNLPASVAGLDSTEPETVF
jgi:adenylylsulfate kinase